LVPAGPLLVPELVPPLEVEPLPFSPVAAVVGAGGVCVGELPLLFAEELLPDSLFISLRWQPAAPTANQERQKADAMMRREIFGSGFFIAEFFCRSPP